MRHRIALIAVVVATLSLTACSDAEPGGASLNGKGTSQSNPADVPVQYLRLPDGRILECIITSSSGYPIPDCNWDHPVNVAIPVPTPTVT